MKKLYIFRGLPGSGKSTLARKFAPMVIEADVFRYDADMNYVFNTRDNTAVLDKRDSLLSFVAEKLELQTIAVTAVYTKVDHMLNTIEIGQKNGYSVNVIECYGEYKSPHNVPETVVQRMCDEFEPLDDKRAKDLNVTLFRHRYDVEKNKE